MSGSTTRGGSRFPKFVTDPEYLEHVQVNSRPVYNPVGPETTGSPYIDPTTGKKYPGAPGSQS